MGNENTCSYHVWLAYLVTFPSMKPDNTPNIQLSMRNILFVIIHWWLLMALLCYPEASTALLW